MPSACLQVVRQLGEPLEPATLLASEAAGFMENLILRLDSALPSCLCRQGLPSFVRADEASSHSCRGKTRWSQDSLQYKCPLFARKFRCAACLPAALGLSSRSCGTAILNFRVDALPMGAAAGVDYTSKVLVKSGCCVLQERHGQGGARGADRLRGEAMIEPRHQCRCFGVHDDLP